MDNQSVQFARYILSFSWLYHGIFPKLVWVAPLEKALTATIGFSPEVSYFLTKGAGVSEIIFGVIIFFYYRNYLIIQLNIFALLVLCIFVAVQIPVLLIEAFNPVTTNLALIGLSYVLLRNKKALEE